MNQLKSSRVRPDPVVAHRTPSRPNATQGAWPIREQVLTFHNVSLESGERLETLDVRYRLEGALNSARDNLVLVVHALTGTVNATDWWRGVVREGGALDPARHAVLTTNLLGGCDGTTIRRGDGVRLSPPITTRDQAAVLARVLDALGVATPLLVCGGSLGGQVALEFAASFPQRVRAAVVLAAPAAQTAQGLAWNAIMRRAIAIAGPREGLALARMVGMLSYRTPTGLEQRFGRSRGTNGTFLMNEWLAAHGEKLVARFDATSYATLLDAMDAHDVGRDRGGIPAALSAVGARLTGVGIPGDQLYPAESVREWTRAVGAQYVELPSIHGHDAFLLETARVSDILRRAMERVVDPPAAPTNETAAVMERSAPARDTFVRSARTARTATPIHSQTLRVALAGCGHVGGGLLDLLSEPGRDRRAVLVDRVLIRDGSRRRPSLEQAIAHGSASPQARVIDPTVLLDDDTDVLVEVIGGTTTARTLVEAALQRGIRVVTANKALLAARGPELVALAHAHGTRIDFEGAVAGAIPVIRCIRHGAAGVGIHCISGILNGTSNFVLDCVTEGASLAEAIGRAQQLGYAEADPTRDLSGEDAEDKLRVLAWLVFGIHPTTLTVVRRGIDAETASWAARVAAEGDRVKLIASCAVEHGALVARIIPTRVSRDDPWAGVSGPTNRIVIESTSAGALVLQGTGAGGRATAGAVLSDLLG
ncbi:MAG: homoserine dehydrogenase [Gemmatimonadaceae bacterium]|nr:homoserine dehydrogenase [Gemmatimonadaceae bacterium]